MESLPRCACFLLASLAQELFVRRSHKNQLKECWNERTSRGLKDALLNLQEWCKHKLSGKKHTPHTPNGKPPPEVTLEKPQREIMIVSSSMSGTYQGVNANMANKGANGAGWYPGAMLDLGPKAWILTACVTLTCSLSSKLSPGATWHSNNSPIGG